MSDILSTINARNTQSASSRIGGLSSNASSTAPIKGMDMTDFYKLMAVQLQYQDMDNPMDTGEMMNQLVQTQMAQAITQMTTAISDLSTVNMFSYASSLMGREVTVAEVGDNGQYSGKETKGTVTGVTLGATPSIFVDGKEYSLVQVMSVGQVPSGSSEEK